MPGGDTLKAYDTLRSHFSDEQARTLVETLPEIMRFEELVTKKDLEVALLRMENRLVRWVLGSVIGLGAFLAAIQAVVVTVLFYTVK